MHSFPLASFKGKHTYHPLVLCQQLVPHFTLIFILYQKKKNCPGCFVFCFSCTSVSLKQLTLFFLALISLHHGETLSSRSLPLSVSLSLVLSLLSLSVSCLLTSFSFDSPYHLLPQSCFCRYHSC